MSKASSTAGPEAAQGGDEAEALGHIAAAWRIGGPDYLPYRITLLAKLLDRCTTRLLQTSSGLSVAEWRVLAQLANASPASASVRQLAEQAWVDRAEVSRAASSLERRGHIERRENTKTGAAPCSTAPKRGWSSIAGYRPRARTSTGRSPPCWGPNRPGRWKLPC